MTLAILNRMTIVGLLAIIVLTPLTHAPAWAVFIVRHLLGV